MGQIERFEDLVAWSKARALTKSIYQLCKQSELGNDYGLARQMQRASVSIMSNIAEGFERRSMGEFQHFLTIAKASCAELRSQIYVALDCDYIDEQTFAQFNTQAEEVTRIISGLRTAVERKRQNQQQPK